MEPVESTTQTKRDRTFLSSSHQKDSYQPTDQPEVQANPNPNTLACTCRRFWRWYHNNTNIKANKTPLLLECLSVSLTLSLHCRVTHSYGYMYVRSSPVSSLPPKNFTISFGYAFSLITAPRRRTRWRWWWDWQQCHGVFILAHLLSYTHMKYMNPNRQHSWPKLIISTELGWRSNARGGKLNTLPLSRFGPEPDPRRSLWVRPSVAQMHLDCPWRCGFPSSGVEFF